MVAPDRAVGDDILHDRRKAAHHGVPPHAGALVHRRQAADDDEVGDVAVPAKGRLLGQDHLVADDAVVPDVALDHVEAV